MLIESVELINIKSYAEDGCAIKFQPGVNLIWGDNGSGKTTILEAIGYCLFDALDYNLTQFVREGCSRGKIAVTFLHNDARRYTIQREIGIPSRMRILDGENGRVLCPDKPTATTWLKEQLDVEYGKYTKELFRNSIGVPQGMMTSSFMQTEAPRRAIFDPIIRIDEYKKAFDALLDTRHKLGEMLRERQTEISELWGQLKALPDVRSALNDLDQKISDGQMSLGLLEEHLKSVQSELSDLVTTRKKLDDLDRYIFLAERDLGSLQERVKTAAAELQDAQRATELVSESQPGYTDFLKSKQDENLLQQQRVERDKLAEQLQSVERKLAVVTQRMDQSKYDLEEVAEAEQKVQELIPQVAQQEEMEIALREVEAQIQKRNQLIERLRDLEIWIKERGTYLSEIQSGLNRRVELAGEIQKFTDELHQKQNDLSTIGNEIERLQNQCENLNKPIEQAILDEQRYHLLLRECKRLEDEILQDAERFEIVKSELMQRSDITAQLTRLDTDLRELQIRQQAAGEEKGSCAQKLKELKERLEILSNAESAECPVCCRPLDEHQSGEIIAEFRHEQAEWEQQQSNAKNTEKTLKKETDANRQKQADLRDELERLAHENEKVTLEKRIEQNRAALNRRRAETAALSESSAKVEELNRRRDVQNSELQVQSEKQDRMEKERYALAEAIGQLNQEAAGLPTLAQEQDISKEIALKKDKQSRITSEAGSFADADERVKSLRDALQRLGDPRVKSQFWSGRAARRNQLEADRLEADQLYDEQSRLKVSLVEALEPYQTLDHSLAEVRTAMALYESDYNVYLANIQAAGTVPGRQARLDDLNNQVQKLDEQLTADRRERAGISAMYDANYHQEIQRDFDETQGNQKTLKAQLGEWLSQKVKLEDQKRTLEVIEIQHQTVIEDAKHLDRIRSIFDFIRNGIQRASPEIGRQRVRAVSNLAAQIFQDILGDLGLTLEWDEGYAIQVHSGNTRRAFDQLSGGEQMAAAIAVRLALLLQMADSNLRWLFLDEPTANMDDKRRDRLADRITQLSHLDQIFVITHDDAFERDTHHVIQVSKQGGVSIARDGIEK